MVLTTFSLKESRELGFLLSRVLYSLACGEKKFNDGKWDYTVHFRHSPHDTSGKTINYFLGVSPKDLRAAEPLAFKSPRGESSIYELSISLFVGMSFNEMVEMLAEQLTSYLSMTGHLVGVVVETINTDKNWLIIKITTC